MTSRMRKQQRPVVDLLVALVAVPTLIVFALQLEKNMQDRWAEEIGSRWIVLGLGIGMLIISLLICGYVTHRMGVCLWTGPLDDPSPLQQTYTRRQIANSHLRHLDALPPSYDSVIKFDIPPPPYDWVIVHIENETKQPPIEATSSHI